MSRRLHADALTEQLFHGTTVTALPTILQEGLHAPAHLTGELDTALYYADTRSLDDDPEVNYGVVLTLAVPSAWVSTTMQGELVDPDAVDWEATGGQEPDTSLQHIVYVDRDLPPNYITTVSWYDMLGSELGSCTPAQYLANPRRMLAQVQAAYAEVTRGYDTPEEASTLAGRPTTRVRTAQTDEHPCPNCDHPAMDEQVSARGIFLRQGDDPDNVVRVVSWEPTHMHWECPECGYRETAGR